MKYIELEVQIEGSRIPDDIERQIKELLEKEYPELHVSVTTITSND